MSITFDFAGKVVLITGGSQGIGLAVAMAFADAGADVHVTGTRPTPDSYAGDVGRFTYHQARMQDGTARRQLGERLPTLDILVNNAGMSRDDEYDEAGYRDVIEVNQNAVVDLCYLFKDRLAAARGTIVNLGSVASYVAIRDHPAYSASKAAVLGFTRSIADKWAKDGIRVNMVAPGFIETQMTNPAAADAEQHRAFLRSIPARRFGQPSEIATVVLFLASPEAEYIRGHGLVVDGGYLLR